MKEELDYIQSKEIAIQLIRNMQYDNGCININEPEKKLPIKHLDKITKACTIFFGSDTSLIDDAVLEDISCGDYDDNQLKYSHLNGYKELNSALGKFFDIM